MLDELENMLVFARDLAWHAGKITLSHFQKKLSIDLKEDNTPVTIADRETEAYISATIAAKYPDHAILGEEFGENRTHASHRWIIDPIDGTQSFIHGVPLYGVMIALEREGVPVLGVVNFPALSEMIYAAQGCGCWWNTHPCHVSQVSHLQDSLVLASMAKDYEPRGRCVAYERLLKAAGIFRTWGDSYGYMLVATGRAEVMFDANMEIWDAAAFPPILQEAGGTFTDWCGVNTIYSREGIATNSLVLSEVLHLVEG